MDRLNIPWLTYVHTRALTGGHGAPRPEQSDSIADGVTTHPVLAGECVLARDGFARLDPTGFDVGAQGVGELAVGRLVRLRIDHGRDGTETLHACNMWPQVNGSTPGACPPGRLH